MPFAWVGRLLEGRGTAQHVVMLADAGEVARHPRATARRLVLEPAPYEGASTGAVRAPTPLGRRARRQLAGLPGLLPGLPAPAAVARPLAAYVALVDDAIAGTRRVMAER